MINAFFVDFYGTLVYEDGAIVKKITEEIFKMALKKFGLKKDEVIHIGDSINSDYNGASNVGGLIEIKRKFLME